MSTVVKESPKIPLVAFATVPVGKGRQDITIIVPFKKGKRAADIADFMLDIFMKEDPDLATKDFTRAHIRGQLQNRIRTHQNVQLLKFDNGCSGYRTLHGDTQLSPQQFRFYRNRDLEN